MLGIFKITQALGQHVCTLTRILHDTNGGNWKETPKTKGDAKCVKQHPKFPLLNPIYGSLR